MSCLHKGIILAFTLIHAPPTQQNVTSSVYIRQQPECTSQLKASTLPNSNNSHLSKLEINKEIHKILPPPLLTINNRAISKDKSSFTNHQH